ncbi:glioma pathogenesis-related protein 1-like [Corvus cornix cornix]|uniref:glioma pathogenesis-related protein 1 n=1 Tax=Corvus brachyrhynchos TaxID=85066 RepID=UPI0004DE199C|nr:PREDICTED: glioma pathogenesis-related protein 1 [Corvus brachyrhynchos]XP_019135326.1 glioma pathogenesis-related protein 1-like [Corvus cornix cornix]
MKITFYFAALFLLDFFTCFHADLQYPLPDIEDAKFIEDCVRAHNTFRSKVNPPASNMFRMSWDAALAKTAKAWAKKCTFNHNTYLETPGKMHPTFALVGENIWTGTAHIFSVDAALRAWFNEVSSYDFSTNTCTDKCGHYTQVVWAESFKVGCAVHFCSTVENFPGLFKAAHFVCNYGPAGNYPRKPYKEGQPCSRCSNEKCVDKLCENTEREKLISNANWYPDWDTQPQPPRPRPPRPAVPSYVPPAEHPRPSCDQYCLSVLILRPLFLVLSASAVLLVQQQFPHRFFYE